MSEAAVSITTLNDFIFGPASIYFHSLDEETENMTYQCADQLNGKLVFQSIYRNSDIVCNILYMKLTIAKKYCII